MRLTRGADYGARGVVYLARQPNDSVLLVGEIASAEGMPESYLAKIFQALAREGIVRSHRGAGGGFSLGRSPGEITLRQVVEAIDGPIALCRCLGVSGSCDRMAGCSLYPVLREAQERLLALLGATTFDDLAQDVPRQADWAF